MTGGSKARPLFGFTIDLPVRNEWKNVDLLRTSVQNCFAALFREIDGSHAVSMVTGELLENAMKYGEWCEAEDCDRTMHLSIQGNAERAIVRVKSPIIPDSENVRRLFATLEWIRSFGDPQDAYRARLKMIADGEVASGQLGLVRVAYEGGGIIDAKIEGQTVTVTAQIPL